MKNYRKSGLVLLAAAAMFGATAMHAEDGVWRNINYKVADPSGCKGWSGNLTGVNQDQKVGEIYYSAGMLYQVIPDAPAGDYTLSANAFYRCAAADKAYALRKAGNEIAAAHLFIGEEKADIKSLFDVEAATDDNLLDAEGNYVWGVVPNTLEEARTAFDAGLYANSVTAHHEGGDLVVGLRNLGNGYKHVSDGTLYNEWVAFSDFKLVGPEGEVELVNPSFSESGLSDDNWNTENVKGANKKRSYNHNGCVFSKTNASPYNISQTLEGLPAGKYRFHVNAFMSYGHGNDSGFYVNMKGQWEKVEGSSAYDNHVNGTELESDHAYIYVNEGEKEPGYLDENNINPWPVVVIEGNDYSVRGYQTQIKCLFDEELSEYPDCEDSNDYLAEDGVTVSNMWWESGSERESAAMFVNHPELYDNTVEIELTEESNTLTFGLRKDVNNPSQYWQPSADWRLEYFDTTAVENGVNEIAASATDSNAAVEYYNMQGMRVVEPSNGIYIVKQGNKVSKKVIR